MKNILVTGGAGFIGANFVIYMMEKYPEYNVIVYDKLTYAGNMDNLLDVSDNPRFHFVKGDICDAELAGETLQKFEIDTIVNFAAETHVDRSILDPDAFLNTNVYGTYVLLEAARQARIERFHQISTDEVYGDVEFGQSSRESDPLEPRSPYAASKASADLMVNAYAVTHGLPVTITRGSNNIGPYQYPEKAVPLFTTNALEDEPIPVYGDGRQMREYQYVVDHCEAIDLVLQKGAIGETYNVGTGIEVENLDMLNVILERLGKPKDLITRVDDRPGHDRRYSLNIDKIKALGWEPTHSPDEAIKKTVDWYTNNRWWWERIKSGEFKEYYQLQYGKRLEKAAANKKESIPTTSGDVAD